MFYSMLLQLFTMFCFNCKGNSPKARMRHGDGRFDSLGHSAKYGVYTMFCTTILKVVHFELVQANETGGSQQTELEGAKRCLSFLQYLGLLIGIFVSDRHRGIAKWIRENCVNTKHYFDIWHVARSLGKKLLALSREKGCEILKEWMKGIRKHLYWCATSTKAGFESHILATWNSLLHHVSNKHNNHPDPLYKQCCHGQLEPRRWIRVGTEAFDKLKLQLTKKMLLNDIKKLSPDAQTSCLKMPCFTWLGTLSRHILTSLHFNENLQRETQKAFNGKEYIRVTYPKFKMGEEVV
ncbi:unnamed protein product [Pocillopora meandrina]|uniref:Transposase n=1 Tax=Pocillopora meandrina TaxID=46732 RepID=A0AAU9XSR5_9CNID|nr:unnamed protein product [Pocillopora meandrina]